MITDMQAGGKDLTVGTDGYTSSSHMAIESIRLKTGGAYRLVSYSSGRRAVRFTVTGETLATTQFISEQMEFLRSGHLRPLAVFSDNTVEVPGVGKIKPVNHWIKDFRVTADYFGLFLPKGTPTAVVDTLNHIWATQISSSTALRTYTESSGANLTPKTGAEAQAVVDSSIRQLAWIYYDAGIAKVNPQTLGIPRLRK